MKISVQALATICIFLTACESVGNAATGRRDVTEKEARDLVAAFLKLPNADVLKSGDMGYRDFYDFMAILGASGGEVGVLQVRYYAVDRQTADVWSSVVCQRITSPSLRKLQRALRKRVGLTDMEYRKIQRQGPLCEPGMPRAPDEGYPMITKDRSRSGGPAISAA